MEWSMRGALILGAVLVSFSGTALPAQTREDSAAVRAAARDYIMAWYDGDAALMEQVLHPDLAKRNVSAGQDGRSRFSHMGAMAMVRATRTRTKQPADRRMLEVTLLDLQPPAASAKVVSWDFVDYVHLGRLDGRWVIINDLWTGRVR
jgi:hypothetical protein